MPQKSNKLDPDVDIAALMKMLKTTTVQQSYVLSLYVQLQKANTRVERYRTASLILGAFLIIIIATAITQSV